MRQPSPFIATFARGSRRHIIYDADEADAPVTFVLNQPVDRLIGSGFTCAAHDIDQRMRHLRAHRDYRNMAASNKLI